MSGGKHTPLPWFNPETLQSGFVGTRGGIWSGDKLVARCNGASENQTAKQGREVATANAEFIVEACNAYAALAARVKALEAGLGELVDVADAVGYSENICTMDGAIERARALLAQGEKG